jgi:hypothetical protein
MLLERCTILSPGELKKEKYLNPMQTGIVFWAD